MSEEASVSSNTTNYLTKVLSTNGLNKNGRSSNNLASHADANSKQQLPNREQIQIMKLREANNKYKSLLKMAKERIQEQEEELEAMQSKLADLEKMQDSEGPATAHSALTTDSTTNDEIDSIIRISQRIKVDDSAGKDTTSEIKIWALVDYETDTESGNVVRKYQKWHSFRSEAELSDFIRRDSGEPLVLPPYSLTPEQSAAIQLESEQAVAHVTEEFRRFRVRAEVARKQADATVRALHNNNVVTTRAKIHGQDLENELQQARTDHAQLASLQRELAEQENHWKEAYDTLLAENTALKSSGAEALLAAQWRQRYETSQRERDDLETNFKMLQSEVDILQDRNKARDAGKYEIKYRDLKESFRLYRKKAKEIFEAQQSGNSQLLSVNDKGLEDARMLYLRNLMVNYLSSDPAVRDHMEGAISTVLRFSEDEKIRIEQKREEADHGTWMNKLGK